MALEEILFLILLEKDPTAAYHWGSHLEAYGSALFFNLVNLIWYANARPIQSADINIIKDNFLENLLDDEKRKQEINYEIRK